MSTWGFGEFVKAYGGTYHDAQEFRNRHIIGAVTHIGF